MKHVVLCILLVPWQMFVDACDPDTQYLKDDVCCKMCGPGLRMNSKATCEDPVCVPCEKNEYQSGYTREKRCKLQPVCDRNLNLEQKELNTKSEVPCTCKPEHHCSIEECLTCVQNTVCKAGEGVYKTATQFNDTVCQRCGEGTFSNESSAVGKCRPWQRCEEQMQILKEGTPTSDVECVEKASYLTAVLVALSFGVLFFFGVVVFIKKRNFFKERLRDMLNKTRDDNDKRNEEPLVDQEQGLEHRARNLEQAVLLQQPVEDQDPSLPLPVQPIDVTENGNPVRKEEGKTAHAPVPERCMSSGHIDMTADEP